MGEQPISPVQLREHRARLSVPAERDADRSLTGQRKLVHLTSVSLEKAWRAFSNRRDNSAEGPG